MAHCLSMCIYTFGSVLDSLVTFQLLAGTSVFSVRNTCIVPLKWTKGQFHLHIAALGALGPLMLSFAHYVRKAMGACRSKLSDTIRHMSESRWAIFYSYCFLWRYYNVTQTCAPQGTNDVDKLGKVWKQLMLQYGHAHVGCKCGKTF